MLEEIIYLSDTKWTITLTKQFSKQAPPRLSLSLVDSGYLMRRRNTDVHPEEPPCNRKKLSVNNNIMPAVAIKSGEILTDLTGKQWKLGRTIGTGGFGEIFLASDDTSGEVTPNSQYVAKVETHNNGPLFVEINCYLRIAKNHSIHEWKNRFNLAHLGMPHYVASGSHMVKGMRYRFLIIPRFEKDLEQIFESKSRKFNLKTVLTIIIQLLDTLEYIHGKGYIHSDIKASNLLLQVQQLVKETKKETNKIIRYNGSVPLRTCRLRKMTLINHCLRPNVSMRYVADCSGIINNSKSRAMKVNNGDQIYLLDFGLAAKYLHSNGQHKEYCADERKAHAGTILFCSSDAHRGAQSRRSDLESLGYNMIYWLTSSLPWIDDTEPHSVHKMKQKCLANLDEFLTNCFSTNYPKVLYDYFKYLVELDFEAEPDYDYCKRLFRNALKDHGYKDNSKFDFDNLEVKEKVKQNIENKTKSKRVSYKLNRVPLTSNLPVKPELRKKRQNKKVVKVNWSKILMDPEIILKQGKTRDRKSTECSDPGNGVLNLDVHQLNPTYAMLDVFNRCTERANLGYSPKYKGDCSDHIEGYTSAMMAVYNRKKEREELEKMVVYNGRTNNKSNKTSTASRKKILSKSKKASLPRTRGSKSVQDVKKDSSKKLKTVPSTRSYRLRG